MPVFHDIAASALATLFYFMGFYHSSILLPQSLLVHYLDLYVGQVQHKALIEVNEEGTKASAATVVEERARGGGPIATPKPPHVTFNRPFLYWIYERENGMVLFAGRKVE